MTYLPYIVSQNIKIHKIKLKMIISVKNFDIMLTLLPVLIDGQKRVKLKIFGDYKRTFKQYGS